MPPKAKKQRTVADENRTFNDEWKVDFFFSLRETDNLPMCVICGNTVSVLKKLNLERHYSTHHKMQFDKRIFQIMIVEKLSMKGD